MNLSERKRYRRGLNRFAWTRAARTYRRFMSFPETSVNDFYFSFSVSPPSVLPPYAPVRERMDP